jgi:hypothetical protein
MDSVELVWRKIRVHLENEQRRVYEEIKQYPRPIPACDAQFNYLLEQRAGLAREVEQVDEVSKESLGARDPRKYVDEFLRSSKYIDEEAKQRIRSSL